MKSRFTLYANERVYLTIGKDETIPADVTKDFINMLFDYLKKGKIIVNEKDGKEYVVEVKEIKKKT